MTAAIAKTQGISDFAQTKLYDLLENYDLY